MNVYEHFNPACRLAPVGSPLIIRIRDTYTVISPEGKLENLHAEQPMQVKVKRLTHLKVGNRDGEMVYEAEDKTVYQGRFEWTHA